MIFLSGCSILPPQKRGFPIQNKALKKNEKCENNHKKVAKLTRNDYNHFSQDFLFSLQIIIPNIINVAFFNICKKKKKKESAARVQHLHRYPISFGEDKFKRGAKE